jgi:hypothetical protein
MSRSIELSDEDYARLEQAAEMERLTPAEWIARRIPMCGEAEAQPSPNGEPDGTTADVLTGRVGEIVSGRNQAGAEVAYATMAERLAGRIGRIGSGTGEPSSDNVAKSFAEYLEAKQRAGHL